MKIVKINKKSSGRVLIATYLAMFIFSASVQAQEIRRISMDFQDVPLKNVLKIFSQQAGLNFVATENIENKRITLYLDNVTVQDALNSIMNANNLTYEQAPGSSVFVVKESGKAKAEMCTKIYTLNYARVTTGGGGTDGRTFSESDIKGILENLLSKDDSGRVLGNVIVDRRTNSIIVTSIPMDFSLIEETIAKLDAHTPQAMIEAEIVEVYSSALKKIGLSWGNQTTGTFVSFSGPSKLTHFPFIRNKNPLSKALLGDTTSESTTTTTTGGATTTATQATQTSTLSTLSLAEFSIIIKALESQGDARYLAKPRIMVLNNETAEIKITAASAVGVKSSSQSTTGSLTEEAERVETGVMLKVTPTINKDDYITMTLEPEVSRVVTSGIANSRGVRFLDPAKRSAKTTVMVKDKQTIAIGGLLKSDEADSKNRVPVVSKIPLLGELFKNTEKDVSSTEIIIFITSHVVRDVNELNPPPSQLSEALTEKETAQMKAPIPTAEKPTPPAKETIQPALAEPPEAKEAAEAREAEVEKTVIKLRKKRELSR